MDARTLLLTQAGISACCWAIVCAGATTAIFSARINDTLLERIALACIAIMALAAGWRAMVYGWVTNTGWLVSMALAFYVVAVFVKHWRHDAKPTEKKP